MKDRGRASAPVRVWSRVSASVEDMSVGTRFVIWAPVVLHMMFIFVLSSMSSPPTLPGGLGDKSGHALLYCGLGALLVRAWAGGWRRPVTWGTAVAAVAAATLYGVTDEIHQHFVPHRQTDFADVLADAVGAGAAAGALYVRSRAAESARRRGV